MLNKTHEINKNTPIPLYFQLKNLILAEIKAGTYKTGSAIPTELEISTAFQLSRTTVRQSISELVQEGWLYRVKSKGTFVSQPKISQDFIKRVESFNDQMIRSGMVPSTELLEAKEIPANTTIASALNMKEGESVIYLSRKRCADNEPLVTIETYLPAHLCQQVLERNLENERLYTILGEKHATTIYRVDRLVEVAEATTTDVKLLDIKKGKPIQLFYSTGYNEDGLVIEYSIARYRGDRSSFEITVFPDAKP